MDSPDRNLTIAPTDSQGSPFFNYLCSLSPIKPVKSGHVVQTFAELSIPPPPAVFISPRVDTQKDSIPLERKSSTDRWESTQATSRKSEGKFQCDEERNILSHSSHVRAARLSWNQVSNCHRGCLESINTAGSALSSPHSRLVMYENRNMTHFVSEPDVGVSQQCSSKLASPSVCLADPSSNDLVENEVAPQNQLAPSRSHTNENPSEGAVSCQISPSLDCQDLSTAIPREESISMKQIGTGFGMPSKDKDNKLKGPFWEAHGEPLELQKYSENEQLLELDQATTGITSIASMELGKDSPHGDKHDHKPSSAVQTEIPIKHMLGFLAAIREIVEEDTQLADFDAESFQSKLSFLSDRKLEHVWDLQNNTETQTCRPGSRAAMSGVRRRCLDFETTEAQQRSLNNLPMLETIGLSPDKLSHCASSHGSDANSASSLINESITAIAELRNGQSSQLNTLSSKEDLVSGSKAPMAQATVFYPHCSKSPNNADCASLQCDTQLNAIYNSPEISPVPVETPSGLGLHLNSLGKSMPFSFTRDESMNCCALSSSSKSEKFPKLAPLSSISEVSSEGYGDYMLSGANILAGSAGNFGQGLTVSLVERTQLDQHEVQSAGSAQVGLTKSTTCVRSVTLDFKPLQGNLPFGEVENIINPLGGKRVFLQDIPHESESDQAEDSGHSPKSPKKKRKMSISAGEKPGEGCKRCNCKKSKCLKLYCECFAAGVYCIDPCSCHDCFNKPEFEEIVLGTRQQIESRNPLAFAPKVVRATDLSPTNGEDCIYTPASARHKRGCNCKKSQCLKKYCECYQAGVGCADGCRCEGCKNIYGRKEEEEKEDQMTVLENESTYNQVDILDMAEHEIDQQNMDLSLLTTSFEHSGQCMSAVGLRSNSSQTQCPSEDLSSPSFSVPAPMPFRSPSKLLRFLKGEDNTFLTSAHSLKTEGSPGCITKFTKAGQFSPRWDGLADICTLTPLPHSVLQPAPAPAPASASFLDKAPSCPSLQLSNGHSTSYVNAEPNDVTYREISSSPIVQHSSPPVFMYGNYQYQALENALTAPMTSMSSSYVHALEVKHDSGKPVDTRSPERDDTPNYFKDSNALGAPAIILKTRSPQQKRVSSHQQTPRGTSFRDMLSPGLRSGWKFILQAMPSFPPPNPTFPFTNAGVASDYPNQSQ